MSWGERGTLETVTMSLEFSFSDLLLKPLPVLVIKCDQFVSYSLHISSPALRIP